MHTQPRPIEPMNVYFRPTLSINANATTRPATFLLIKTRLSKTLAIYLRRSLTSLFSLSNNRLSYNSQQCHTNTNKNHLHVFVRFTTSEC